MRKRKRWVAPKLTKNPDNGMDDLRDKAEGGERVVLCCPACGTEDIGDLSIDISGDVRWECPHCGPNNLSWVAP